MLSEGVACQGIQFRKSYPKKLFILFDIITLMSKQMKFPSSSLLVVDFTLVVLLFPMAIKSHIGTCYYIASQVLRSVKYKLSVLKTLLSECHYSHHRCWLSRSLFYSHLIPVWTKLNSKARTCLFPKPLVHVRIESYFPGVLLK